MTGARAHLFVPMLHRNDAVGRHTIAVRDALRQAGVASQIYTDRPDPATVGDTVPFLEYEKTARPDDVLIYQLATDSDMAAWVSARPERLVLNHHSITPPEYFVSWNNAIARLQVGALQRLEELAARAVLGVADSEFNATELRRAGCTNTVVVPVAGIPAPPLDPGQELIERVRQRQAGAGGRWLSVGRLAPNKAHHHAIAALFVARATTDPDARLTLVGSPAEPAYAAALRTYAAALGLSGAVEFIEGISDAELAARYRCADVLVMLSDHEGFGVPLVEAMGHGTPIVAFDAGAVDEVLDGCGVLLEEKHPRAVAAAVAALMEDVPRRQGLITAGRDRFDALGLERAANRLVEAVQNLPVPVAARS